MPPLNRAHSYIDRRKLPKFLKNSSMAKSNLENLYQCQSFFGILTFHEAKTILREALMNQGLLDLDGRNFQKYLHQTWADF